MNSFFYYGEGKVTGLDKSAFEIPKEVAPEETRDLPLSLPGQRI